eukprot:CAMPEP_0172421228 /NCGR_PEP_ID=MMETSP1064-20121228/7501_1 /TAXON_ID=202472 /ORGANISM="Aulacoseira subarctica , Strain CCAP 1002/5" /LENGTH=176 /DNA_ID=CAMNT_0013161527 /DNA_START=273 /DNA_END=804 /DNA_ORIENTATION=-
MAKRALQNIGGVDSSVPLSPADELLLSEKLHSQHGQLQRRATMESESSEDYNNKKTRTGYRNLEGNTVAQRSPTKIRFSSKQSVSGNEDEVQQHQDYEGSLGALYLVYPPSSPDYFDTSDYGDISDGEGDESTASSIVDDGDEEGDESTASSTFTNATYYYLYYFTTTRKLQMRKK